MRCKGQKTGMDRPGIQDQESDDSIIRDQSLFGPTDLVDAHGNVNPNTSHLFLRYCAKGKFESEIRRLFRKLAGMQNESADFFVAGEAISELQATSESWCKQHIGEVMKRFQNSVCPTHPVSRLNPLKPAHCLSALECPCGSIATLRIVMEDYLNNKRKGAYARSMA